MDTGKYIEDLIRRIQMVHAYHFDEEGMRIIMDIGDDKSEPDNESSSLRTAVGNTVSIAEVVAGPSVRSTDSLPKKVKGRPKKTDIDEEKQSASDTIEDTTKKDTGKTPKKSSKSMQKLVEDAAETRLSKRTPSTKMKRDLADSQVDGSMIVSSLKKAKK